MVVGLLLLQLLLCGMILQQEVVRYRCRNYATSVFFAVYSVVYVIEPLVLHTVFGGARSIVVGRGFYVGDPLVYYVFSTYGIALLVTNLLLGRVRGGVATAVPGFGGRERGGRSQASCLALGVLGGVGLFVWSTGMSLSSLVSASRFAWFGEGSRSLLWLTVSGYFIALSCAYVYYAKVCGTPNRWLLLLCLGSLVVHGIITKDRKWIIFVVSGWLAARYDLSGRRLWFGRRALWSLGALFLLLVSSGFVRDVLFRYSVGEHVDFATEIVDSQSNSWELGDISYFYRSSLEAIHQNIDNGLVVPLALPRRVLLFFLPARYSGGLKVEDISATFSDVVDGGDALRRGNMPPGLFGLFVVSFGWLASFVAIPALALGLKKLDSLFRVGQGAMRNSALALYLFSVVLAFRGDDSSALYYVISTAMFVGLTGLVGRPRGGSVRIASGVDAT